MSGPQPCRVAVIPGDGIGREVTPEAVRVLAEVGRRFGIGLSFEEGLAGGAAIDATGHPIPPETIELCRRSDAILVGACGGPQWDKGPAHLRPEQALFTLRKTFQLYANLRPAKVSPPLFHASPLRREVVEGTDILIVRELCGGLYYGAQSRIGEGDQTEATDTLPYSASEIRRVVRKACEIARLRPRHKVTSVDKANVLETSRLWREVATETVREFPDIALEHMLVDNAALQLVRDPRQFDVIVTENTFGDILSDEAAGVIGSLGLMPSASLGRRAPALFEPVHGTAPDIAGKGIANPLAAILTGALLLRYGAGHEAGAAAIERAVTLALEHGCRTGDMAGRTPVLGTREMTDAVLARLT
ncbi:MAG TPA: 3-isopropylmalate dehydrogenase [bacterium]|nr:3-isopropylmalate dehydrogenase [bacterium]